MLIEPTDKLLTREDIGRPLNVSPTYLGKPLGTQQLGKVFVGADGARLGSSIPAAEGFYDALAVPIANVARMPAHR